MTMLCCLPQPNLTQPCVSESMLLVDVVTDLTGEGIIDRPYQLLIILPSGRPLLPRTSKSSQTRFPQSVPQII